MRARWYQAQTGQFTSVDPAFSQTDQAYSYTSADPVNASDPSGMFNVGFSKCGQYLPGGPKNCPSSRLGILSWIGHIVRNRLAQTIFLTVVGVAGAATGIGAVVELGLGATELAGTLGTASTVLGFVSDAADIGQCIPGHDKSACVSAALDLASSAFGVIGGKLAKGSAKVLGGLFVAKGFSIGFGSLAWGASTGKW